MAIGASINLRLTIFLILAVIASSTSTAELESTLAALRSHNYNLFANALITSDLLFELHANVTTHDNASIARTFTLFAPPDSALFALDMTATALVYTQTLRYHIVPRRIAASDLLQLRPGSCLPTLLPWREIRVHRRQWRSAVVIAVDGVNVVVPGLYYGEGVAVHGLAGVLNFRSSQIGVRHGWSAVSEMNKTASSSPENQTFIPQIPRQPVAANGSVFSPIPRLPIFNDSIPPPAVNSPLPSSGISSPPEMLTEKGIESPEISPVAEESSSKLHESLVEDWAARMMKRSAKLLEIAFTWDDEPERPSPEDVESARVDGEGLWHHDTGTGFEL